MDIGDLLDRDGVVARASATTKRQVLALVAEAAARRLGPESGATASEVLEALAERERQGSTGVGQGVAVPHARLKGLDRMRGVFLRLETPVDFESVDERPVDLVFALFAPEDAGAEHLRALARVSRTLRHSDLREQLRQARTADAVFALLSRERAEPNAA